MMSLPLEDYGIIGDCQTVALVGKNGSIDWLCFPNFDSGACFAALLGGPENGRWLLAPVGDTIKVSRRYRPETLILETLYETEDGVVEVIDCMPPRGEDADLVRLVRGVKGNVPMRMELIIRFDYGAVMPWVQRAEGGIQAIAGRDMLLLHTPVKLQGRDFTTVAEFTIAAGEEAPFSLVWQPSHHKPNPPINVLEIIQFTDDWWQKWSSQNKYEGLWREAVMRSLITLKALTFQPTGGIVAAATTSLPEHIGGVRNWDYRYCWLRDATFTLYSLLACGFTGEALEWRDWLLRAVAGDPCDLQIMYSIYGERRLTEYEIDWLPGYANSKPVRIGNAASTQFQLDVFGEVLDVLHVCRQEGLIDGDASWKLQRAFMNRLETVWQEPDEGIWEVRGPRRHFTHSKVMAWVAFDRGVKAIEKFGCDGPLDTWRQKRDDIHREVCREGFNEQLGSFVQFYGSDLLDASLLMIPLVGFLPASDPRVQGTLAAIQKNLVRDCFVDRYATHESIDGLPPGESSFLPCSFWLVDNLSLQGRHEEAIALFERLLEIRNDLGLLSEEYDPHGKRLTGNFPQAFSHVGLVNSAIQLATHAGPAAHRQESGTEDGGARD
jgi:GH15 family glucan-1,4-alpha-glucosidase